MFYVGVILLGLLGFAHFNWMFLFPSALGATLESLVLAGGVAFMGNFLFWEIKKEKKLRPLLLNILLSVVSTVLLILLIFLIGNVIQGLGKVLVFQQGWQSCERSAITFIANFFFGAIIAVLLALSSTMAFLNWEEKDDAIMEADDYC